MLVVISCMDEGHGNNNIRNIQIRNHVKIWFYLAFAIKALISLSRWFIVSFSNHKSGS